MKNEKKNNNIINFPNSLTIGEREVEAVKRKKGVTRSLKDILDEIDFHE